MKKLILCSGVLILILSACRKLIDIPEPRTQVSAERVFSDIGTANAAVAGLYSQMMKQSGNLENGGLSFYGGLLSDDIVTSVQNFQYEPFQLNSLTSQDYTVYNFWYAAYSNIYHANAIIAGLQDAGSLPTNEKNALIGEAKLVRSFYYFCLVNLFGDVPLVISVNYNESAGSSRTPVASVYQFLIQDLTDAETLLSATYPSANRFRPCKWVATALLSRVYLYNSNWEEALQSAEKLINATEFTLTASADIASVFAASSPEIIWQLPQVIANEVNTVEGENFIPNPGDVPLFILSGNLLASFEQGDLRRVEWMDSTEIDGTIYRFPYKYKVKYNGQRKENNILMRLAEQYLIRAEAYMKLNKSSEAIGDLNTIRERAGLVPLSPAISISELGNAIASERRHEYFAELGHRWFDLKRTGMADQVLSVEKGMDWQSTDALLPVPLTEMQKNKNLTQNPGY